MKKLMICITTCFLLTTSAFSADKLRLAYFSNYAPFSFMAKGKMNGIFIDVMNELSKRLNIEVEHHGMPWARAQEMVLHGKLDAFITVPTKERRKYTKVSEEPVVVAKFTIFANKTDPKLRNYLKIKNLKDVFKYRLGMYIGSGWAKKNLEPHIVDYSPRLTEALKKLANKRFDLFVDVSQTTKYNIKMLGLQKQVVEINRALDKASFNLCIGKHSKYKRMLPKITKILKQMKDEGFIEKVSQSYY